MGAGKPARWESGESDQGAGKGSEVGQDCAGADVGSFALIVPGMGWLCPPHP